MRKAEPVAGLGAILLLVAVFLDGPLGVIDVLVILLALLMLAVPIVSLTTKRPAKSVGTALLASAFGWLRIVLVAMGGRWLALGGSILAWLGSWFPLKEGSTPGAVAPAIPPRPAPPTERA